MKTLKKGDKVGTSLFWFSKFKANQIGFWFYLPRVKLHCVTFAKLIFALCMITLNHQLLLCE